MTIQLISMGGSKAEIVVKQDGESQTLHLRKIAGNQFSSRDNGVFAIKGDAVVRVATAKPR